MVRKQDLPSTLQKSPGEAQETWKKAHDSAVDTYGEGERAHRTAYSALKHKFEKRGNRWVPKGGKGPSDPRAKHPRSRENKGETYGGVDVEGSSKGDLYERAKELDIKGRSTMSKDELARAVSRRGG